MFRTLLLLLAGRWTSVISAINTEIVWTDSGPVIGEEVTFEGTTYKSFKGIPYAAPPVGNLRFKAPEPPQTWTKIRNATSSGKMCPQPNLSHLSSEDCLTLNVFTKSLHEKDLNAVMMVIHGGGFQSGNGNDWPYGPQYLVQQDIVVVAINYRLGPLGFLATNSNDATGNWGMKDQVAALKWVQANIEEFGGDPKQVTILGNSAGAASVHLHLFSPLSKGLFHKAVLSSGSVANNWVLNYPERSDRYSKDLARLLGASEDEIANPEKRVKFLRAADSIEVTKHSIEVFDSENSSYQWLKTRTFTPVIEAPGTEGAFLTVDPKDLLAKGKFARVPIMMGEPNLKEFFSSSGVGLAKNFTPEIREELEKNVCQMLPESLANAIIANDECAIVAQQIRDVYFDGRGFNSSYLNFVHLWGDIVITKDIYFSQRTHAKFASKANPLFNYYFTFDGEWNMIKKNYNFSLPGAGHVEDLLYVFLSQNMKVLPESSPEVVTKNRMISFITNFVKYGNPTPVVSNLVSVKWTPSNKKEYFTMVIGQELKLEKEFLKSRMELWEQLSEKYDTNFASLTERRSLKDRLLCLLGSCFNVIKD